MSPSRLGITTTDSSKSSTEFKLRHLATLSYNYGHRMFETYNDLLIVTKCHLALSGFRLGLKCFRTKLTVLFSFWFPIKLLFEIHAQIHTKLCFVLFV